MPFANRRFRGPRELPAPGLDERGPVVLLCLDPGDEAGAPVREIAWAVTSGHGEDQPIVEHFFLSHGRAPATLLARLRAAAAGGVVHSDSPTLDGIRLDRLFGTERGFDLAGFDELVNRLSQPGLATATRMAAERHYDRRRGVRDEIAVLIETLRLCRLYAA